MPSPSTPFVVSSNLPSAGYKALDPKPLPSSLALLFHLITVQQSQSYRTDQSVSICEAPLIAQVFSTLITYLSIANS
jgi:hypothetical protein